VYSYYLLMEKFIHAFNLVDGINFNVLRKIFNYIGSWQYAWEKCDLGDFLNAGLSEEIAQRICKTRPVIDANAEMERLWSKNIYCFSDYADEYPPLLKEIPGSPYLLYRKGAPLCPMCTHIAVVGTRLPSQYGEKCAYEIAKSITKNGGVVVSGLAFGIDAIAHQASVNYGSPTVAVLASGLDTITPASNTGLAARILETGGTIISEYARGKPSFKNRFLERNRIISGISSATIVIEANRKSGALITAKHALDQNRDVYALSADITRPQAQGCLRLIEDGKAYPITSTNGLMLDLGFKPEHEVLGSLGETERIILKMLRQKPMAADDICAEMNLSPQETFAKLTLLEMKKLVRKNVFLEWEAL
jgi:DNA processing protein